MTGDTGDERLNPWVRHQIDEARALVGRVVERWEGVEMAIRGSDDDPPVYSYTDPQVPCAQMYILDLVLGGADRVRVGTYQSDEGFGLRVDSDADPLDWGHDGYRYRVLDEVPVGEIRRVDVAVSVDDDVAEIELDVDGRYVLLVAGETYETWTELIEFRRDDESVLVFTSRSDYDAINWLLDTPPTWLANE